jgi:hypothetical protein
VDINHSGFDMNESTVLGEIESNDVALKILGFFTFEKQGEADPSRHVFKTNFVGKSFWSSSSSVFPSICLLVSGESATLCDRRFFRAGEAEHDWIVVEFGMPKVPA